jgi:hypothetical protein
MTEMSVSELLRDQIADLKATVIDRSERNRALIEDLTDQFRQMNGRLISTQVTVGATTERCESHRIELARIAAKTHVMTSETQVQLGKIEMDLRDTEVRLRAQMLEMSKGGVSVRDLVLVGAVVTVLVALVKGLQMLYLWWHASP